MENQIFKDALGSRYQLYYKRTYMYVFYVMEMTTLPWTDQLHILHNRKLWLQFYLTNWKTLQVNRRRWANAGLMSAGPASTIQGDVMMVTLRPNTLWATGYLVTTQLQRAIVCARDGGIETYRGFVCAGMRLVMKGHPGVVHSEHHQSG